MVYKNSEYRQASVAHHISNATKIDYKAMGGKGYRLDKSKSLYDYYRNLNTLNIGRWNGKWRDEEFEREIDNLARYDAIAQQAGLNPRQIARGKGMLRGLDLRRYSNIGGIDTVAFCVSTLGSSLNGREYYPTRKDENNDMEFVKLAESLNLKTRWIEIALPKIQYELSQSGNYDWLSQ